MIDNNTNKNKKPEGKHQNGSHSISTTNYKSTWNDNKKTINLNNKLVKPSKLANLFADPKFLEEDEFQFNNF